jgi:hypothetical protein
VERPSSSVYERIKLLAAMPFLYRKGSSRGGLPRSVVRLEAIDELLEPRSEFSVPLLPSTQSQLLITEAKLLIEMRMRRLLPGPVGLSATLS